MGEDSGGVETRRGGSYRGSGMQGKGWRCGAVVDMNLPDYCRTEIAVVAGADAWACYVVGCAAEWLTGDGDPVGRKWHG